MIASHVLLVGGLMIFAHATVTSSQTPAAQTGMATPANPLVGNGRNPFAGILKPRRGTRPVLREVNGGRAGRPRVVCGMVVVPVDPSADPKILLHPKSDEKMQYKMPRIVPEMCQE